MAYNASAASALKALKAPNGLKTFAGKAQVIDTKTKLTLKVAALSSADASLVSARAHIVTAVANLTAATGYGATVALLNADLTAIDASRALIAGAA